MEWAIVEVDRLDVGERAPKTTLTSFPKVEFLGIADLVLRIGVGAVVVGGFFVERSKSRVRSQRTQHYASEDAVRVVEVQVA